jgi:hypothetical protein
MTCTEGTSVALHTNFVVVWVWVEKEVGLIAIPMLLPSSLRPDHFPPDISGLASEPVGQRLVLLE